MRLKRIYFDKFKNISDSFLEIEPDITCLVGVNEAGKSNVLAGIEKCDKEQALTQKEISRHSKEYLEEETQGPSIEMVFAPSSEAEKRNLGSLFGLEDVDEIRLVKNGKKYRIDYPQPNYEKAIASESLSSLKLQGAEGSQETRDILAVEGNKESIREKIIEETVKLLPKFRYFDSVNFQDYYLPDNGDVEIASLTSTPSKHLPVLNLLKIAGIDPKQLNAYSTPQEKLARDTRLERGVEAANQKLLEAFWPVQKVRIDLKAEAGTLKIRIRDTEQFLPGERSRGLQWALAFNVFFMATTDSDLTNTVLLIDEPGVFLHIDAQRRMLKSTFPRIVREGTGNQIIYSSHLPYLIDGGFPERIRILEKASGDTKIGNKAWSQSAFGSLPEPVRTALGLNTEDAFLFREENIVLEGPSDLLYMRALLQAFNPHLSERINFVTAYGVPRVPLVLALLALSKKKGWALVDSKKDREYCTEQLQALGAIYPKVKSIPEIVGVEEMESIEDVLPEQPLREAIYRAYRRVYERANIQIKLPEIPMQIPRVSNLQTFFSGKLRAKDHKLYKMEVARQFNEIVAANPALLRGKGTESAERLANQLQAWMDAQEEVPKKAG